MLVVVVVMVVVVVLVVLVVFMVVNVSPLAVSNNTCPSSSSCRKWLASLRAAGGPARTHSRKLLNRDDVYVTR